MIIINASILDNKPTGIGIYTLNLLEKFNRLNMIYTLFTSLNNNQKNVQLIKVIKYIRPYPYKKIGGLIRFLINQFYFTWVGKKFNIAYLPTPHGSVFLKNQVVTVHDLLALHFPKQHKLQYYYYKYFMPVILANAKAIVSISESTKNDLIYFYDINPEKIKVIYNGFNQSHFVHKQNAAEYIKNKFKLDNYIFTVGSSYPHKNLDKLIEAFKNLNDNNLVLAITGQVGSYQKVLIEKYNIKNIIFLGYVDYKDLPYLYSAAKAMVYPSLYEGFGFPPLEAMSCHCPVIVSNTSSLPEVCANAVEYIDPNDVSSIEKGIIKVINDKVYRNDLIEKGKLQSTKFSWEKTANELINLFKELNDE